MKTTTLIQRTMIFFLSLSLLLTPKHLAVKNPVYPWKTVISPLATSSTKNFPFWQKKKKQRGKKNKAELPWKPWIAACVSQAWWLKLHSAATSYRPPRLLKVCATSTPDLHSAQSPTMRLTLLPLHKWGFWQGTQRIPSGRMVSIKTFSRFYAFLPSAIAALHSSIALNLLTFSQGEKKKKKLQWNAARVDCVHALWQFRATQHNTCHHHEDGVSLWGRGGGDLQLISFSMFCPLLQKDLRLLRARRRRGLQVRLTIRDRFTTSCPPLTLSCISKRKRAKNPLLLHLHPFCLLSSSPPIECQAGGMAAHKSPNCFSEWLMNLFGFSTQILTWGGWASHCVLSLLTRVHPRGGALSSGL